jgi:hypothetical protein
MRFERLRRIGIAEVSPTVLARAPNETSSQLPVYQPCVEIINDEFVRCWKLIDI